jgi:hypothetical protein
MLKATTTVNTYRTNPSASDATSLRGDAIDEPVGVLTKILGPIPFALKESTKTVWIQETQTAMTVRKYKGRAQAALDIQKGDRIVDTFSGRTFIVDDVNLPDRGMVGETRFSFDLRILGDKS